MIITNTVLQKFETNTGVCYQECRCLQIEHLDPEKYM